MTHQQRTPLVRVLNYLTIASFLIVFLTANVIYTKPVNSENLLDARHELGEALVPKTIEDDAAVAPLSPVHEEARRRWNRAKEPHHLLQPKRYIRNAVEPRSADNASVTVPKYTQELYENLTQRKPMDQRTTRANTVRPLQTVANEQSDCTKFNFSLASINSSEFIIKAELHLHLDKKSMATQKLHVEVSSSNPGPTQSPPPGSGELVIELDINVDKYVLDVSGIVNSWMKQGVRYAAFSVKIYEAPSKDAPIPCSEVEFFHSSSNEDTEPLLVVYSYDNELEKLDYKTVLDNLNKTEVARRRRNVNPDNSDALQTTPQDPVSQDPFCDTFSLKIFQEEIPKMPGESVILPNYFDAKICGGQCGNSLPVVQQLHHNVLIHMLQKNQDFRDRHNHTITRCCAPVKYEPLDVLVHPPKDTETSRAFIRIIPNMKIVQCECLEIIDFTGSQ